MEATDGFGVTAQTQKSGASTFASKRRRGGGGGNMGKKKSYIGGVWAIAFGVLLPPL